MDKKIVIIGGGVIGMSTAFNLAEKGVKDITIIEKENLKGMNLNQLSQPLKKLKEKNYFKPFIETAYEEN